MPSLPASVRRDLLAIPDLQGIAAEGARQFSGIALLMPHVLCDSLLLKIEEQIDRAIHLAGLLPEGESERASDDRQNWAPGALLGHLLDCMAGFCAALYAAEPARLAHFQQLRAQPVNFPIGARDFGARCEIYRAHIAEAFQLLDDDALARSIPTIFVPSGQTLMTLLLSNLEHLINHKRQLFELLKGLRVEVGTADLYRFGD